MPIYDYKCKTCQKEFDLVRSLAAYTREVTCECGGKAIRNFSKPPAVFGDYAAYNCPITGKRIEGRKEHEANLRKHGCRVYEPGETENFRRKKAQEDASLDMAVERTAEEFVGKLPESERVQLGNALESGLDVGLERKTIN